MANIPETPTWASGVLRIETTDQVLGGPDGVVNIQAGHLASRTAYLKVEVESAAAVADSAVGKADDALSQIASAVEDIGAASDSAAAAEASRVAAVAAQALSESARDAAVAASSQATTSKNQAAASATVAQTSASQSTADALQASQNAVAAVTAKNQAEAAAAIAEANLAAAGDAYLSAELAAAARDAALIQSGVYATESAGRAAVADGVAFKVQGTGDVAAFEYRRVNSGSSTLIATYPSSSSVARNSIAIEYFTGSGRDFAAAPFPGYINKTTGAYAADNGWKSTDFIEVMSTSSLRRVGNTVSGTSSSCAIAFYDAFKVFLGSHNTTTTDQTVIVSSHYPLARFVRMSSTSAATFHVYVGASIIFGAVEGLQEFQAKTNAAIKLVSEDHFLASTLSNGFVNLSGAFNSDADWRTTDKITYNPDASYVMTGTGVSGSVASVSAWDSSDNFLGVVLAKTGSFTNLPIVVSLSNVAYLKASAPLAYTKAFVETSSQVPAAALDVVIPDVEALREDVDNLRQDVDVLQPDVQLNSAVVSFITGSGTDFAATTSPGFIAKEDGVYNDNSGWKCTPMIAVLGSSSVRRVGNTISGSSSACAIAFYDAASVFLGFYNVTAGDQTITVGALFPTARFVRVSATSGSALQVLVGTAVVPGAVEGLQEFQSKTNAAIKTDTVDYFSSGALTTGFVNLSGAVNANSGWATTDFIPYNPDAIYKLTAFGSSTSVASVSAWNAGREFLGVVLAKSGDFENQLISVELSNVAFLRASSANSYPRAFTEASSQVDKNALRVIAPDVDDLKRQLQDVIYQNTVDYAASDLSVGYVNTDGVFRSAANWRTTKHISVNENFVYFFTGFGSGLTASVSLWDEHFNFLESAVIASSFLENHSFTVTNPAAKYMQASAAVTYDFSLTASSYFVYGSAITELAQVIKDIESLKTYAGAPSVFAPEQAYALQGEPLYMFARGIVGNRAINVEWMLPDSNADLAIVTPVSTTPIPAKLRAWRADNTPEIVADFNILVTGTPISPATPQNFICLGDSTTFGIGAGQGAYPNELSRRLTGVGNALLTGDQSPAPLGLTNIHFRGTRNTSTPVLTEGRAGWSVNDYLVKTDVQNNAFWNTTTLEFDLDDYLVRQGFDSGAIASGVVPDGSNLTVIILLGWNDVYTTTREASAADLSELIDKIQAIRTETKVIVVGLNPSPQLNFKDHGAAGSGGDRWVSERTTFEEIIKGYGEAYRTVVAEKSNASFLQISHVYNPEISYPTETRLVSGRSANTVTGAIDYVHSNATGYAQIADAIFYKILYDYCRGE